LVLNCAGAVCTLTSADNIASGAKNIFDVSFTFDSAWDGLTRTVVFKNGNIDGEILLIADSATIPWEVLVSPGNLLVGIFGALNGNKILTTNMLNTGRIEQGADVDIVLNLLAI